MTKGFKSFLFILLLLLTFTILTSPVLAIDMFDIDAPDIGEEISSGDPSNTKAWPSEIIQSVKADQAMAIRKMKESGFECWDITRSVSGKVKNVEVKDNFFQKLWKWFVDFFKKITGQASSKIDYEGVDTIFGPNCSCGPPTKERDPITGKRSEVKIFSVFVNNLKYKKSIEAEVSAEFTWDFLGRSWNCEGENPEGSSPERGNIPETVITEEIENVTHSQEFIFRDEEGTVQIQDNRVQAEGFQFDLKGSKGQIEKDFEKKQEELQESIKDEILFSNIIDDLTKKLINFDRVEDILSGHDRACKMLSSREGVSYIINQTECNKKCDVACTGGNAEYPGVEEPFVCWACKDLEEVYEDIPEVDVSTVEESEPDIAAVTEPKVDVSLTSPQLKEEAPKKKNFFSNIFDGIARRLFDIDRTEEILSGHDRACKMLSSKERASYIINQAECNKSCDVACTGGNVEYPGVEEPFVCWACIDLEEVYEDVPEVDEVDVPTVEESEPLTDVSLTSPQKEENDIQKESEKKSVGSILGDLGKEILGLDRTEEILSGHDRACKILRHQDGVQYIINQTECNKSCDVACTGRKAEYPGVEEPFVCWGCEKLRTDEEEPTTVSVPLPEKESSTEPKESVSPIPPNKPAPTDATSPKKVEEEPISQDSICIKNDLYESKELCEASCEGLYGGCKLKTIELGQGHKWCFMCIDDAMILKAVEEESTQKLKPEIKEDVPPEPEKSACEEKLMYDSKFDCNASCDDKYNICNLKSVKIDYKTTKWCYLCEGRPQGSYIPPTTKQVSPPTTISPTPVPTPTPTPTPTVCDLQALKTCIDGFDFFGCMESCEWLEVDCKPGSPSNTVCKEKDMTCVNNCMSTSDSHIQQCISSLNCTKDDALSIAPK